MSPLTLTCKHEWVKISADTLSKFMYSTCVIIVVAESETEAASLAGAEYVTGVERVPLDRCRVVEVAAGTRHTCLTCGMIWRGGGKCVRCGGEMRA